MQCLYRNFGWLSHSVLVDKSGPGANKTGITANVSKSTVGRILAEADIKPHRIKYWLNHEVEDEKSDESRHKDDSDFFDEFHVLTPFSKLVKELEGSASLSSVPFIKFSLFRPLTLDARTVNSS